MIQYLPAAISGVTTLADYFGRKKNKMPKFKNTAAARELKRVSQQGVYSPEVKNNLLAQQAGQLGQQENQRRMSIKGHLMQSGMENSIAGLSPLMANERYTDAQQRDYGRTLDTQNALSKADARMQYAQASDQWSGARRNERSQRFQGLLGGLADTGMLAAQGYQQGQMQNAAQQRDAQMNDLLNQYEAAMKSGDYDTAEAIGFRIGALEGD